MTHINRKAALNRSMWKWLWTAVLVCPFACGTFGKEGEPAPPVFSVPGGVYTNNLTVELKAGEAIVRISFDGSEPNSNSVTYGRPIQITNCTVLRTKAWYPDGRVSKTVSQSYTLLDDDLRKFSSNLPLVVIQSGSGEIAPVEKSFVAARIMTEKTGRVTLLSGADFEGFALSNVRGHSSLRYPKHSYNLKLVNEPGEPQKGSLLQMPKESDWVLYGPYPDKTLMRDVLSYELSNEMGRWAPHTRFVEVFVAETPTRLGMEHYAGVYVLSEKITRDQHRVDIAKINPSMNREPDISGGYIFKKDHTSRRERKTFDAEGPPNAPLVTNRSGFPTPPGGFPADPEGFLPPYDSRTKTARTNSATLRSTARLGAAAERGVAPAAEALPTARAIPPPGRSSATRPTQPPRPKKPKFDPNAPVTNYVPVAIPQGIKIDDEMIFHDDESFRTTIQRNQFYFYEPEPDELTAVQRAWLKDYVNRFETALYSPDFTNATTGYRAFIDSDSFIDYHLLSEVTKNVDAFRFSTFYYKDRRGRLNMGPLWDWNLSFGNANGKQGYMPEHWLWPQLDDQQYSWFRRLFDDPDFGQRYVDRWAQLRTNILATSNILSRIDQLASLLREAQDRNFEKWDILGKNINPNYFVGDSYEEEIEWMKQWTSNRLAWIEKQFVPAPEAIAGNAIELRTSLSDAKIYYTLDGTDPRAPGGVISAAAQTYQAALSRPKAAHLIARVQSAGRWSPATALSF